MVPYFVFVVPVFNDVMEGWLELMDKKPFVLLFTFPLIPLALLGVAFLYWGGRAGGNS